MLGWGDCGLGVFVTTSAASLEPYQSATDPKYVEKPHPPAATRDSLQLPSSLFVDRLLRNLCLLHLRLLPILSSLLHHLDPLDLLILHLVPISPLAPWHTVDIRR